MAGLVPAIHAFRATCKDVDGRDKRGHEEASGAPRVQCVIDTVRCRTADTDRQWSIRI